MELAKVARVGRTYIVKLESGDKRNPSPEFLKRLAKAPRRAGDGAAGVSITRRLRGLVIEAVVTHSWQR